jgi:hypothetical protein
MTSLLDLKRRFVDVPTSAGDIRMWAISASAVAHLIGALPIVKKLLDGKAKDEDFSADKIMAFAPDLVAQLIAAGADKAGDKANIKAAAEASIGDQVALLAGVMEASMPKGAAPFREALLKLVAGVSGNGLKAPATK